MSSENDPAMNDVDFSDDTDVVAKHASVRREKTIDTRTGNEPISFSFLIICAVVLVIGAGYLGATNGGFDGQAYNIYQGEGGAGYTPHSPVPLIDDEKKGPDGKKLFVAACSSCHKTTGLGQPGQYPPLVGSEYVVEDPVRLTMLVLNGIDGPLEVKGNLYNGVMSAQKSAMGDDKVAAVLSYIRSAWGNGQAPISEEMVAQIREKTSDQALPYKFAELQDESAALAAELGAGGGEGDAEEPSAEEPPAK